MKTLLLSSDIQRESIEQLSSLGYRVLTLPRYKALPTPISSHPDSLVFKGEGQIITDKDYFYENEELFSEISSHSGVDVVISGDKLGNKYPSDTRLNAIELSDKLFCRRESVSSAILEYAKKTGLSVINTKQGYPACSTLKIAENAVICADRGLAKLYRSVGISVYEIEPSGISLPPYEYGFIGGASAVADGFVFFFGSLSTHPSHKIIARALEEHSLCPVSLGKGVLCDLGGGILL